MNLFKMTEPIFTKPVLLFVILVVAILAGCQKKTGPPEERPRSGEYPDSLVILPEGTAALAVNVDPDEEYQPIHNFGASDCWSVQHVGKWPASKTSMMADWLFSMDTTAKGQPIGIGLSAWRFNIGTGSASQGDQSGITDEWRRTYSFLGPNGAYNWNAQAGQLWFLQAANERGVTQFIAFANSPHVHFTKNGKAFGNHGDPENIAPERLDDFAGYLADVVSGVKKNTGIEFAYVSPVNEPQWDWTGGGQEGCHMTNSTFLQLVEKLNDKLDGEAGLKTRILVTEAGTWGYLCGEGSTTGNQIETFFGSASPVGTAKNLARIIAGHSYYTTSPASTMIITREQVWNKAISVNDLLVWSTEYCPLGNADLQALGWHSWKKDLGMDVALYVASIIYHDLRYANASAWQWWLALSPYDYPDGLIYVSKNASNGTFSDSKLMWALGNYSRFVRPGAVRVSADCSSDEIFVTAFTHANDQSVSIVMGNATAKAQPVKIIIPGWEPSIARPYITSSKDSHNLMPMKRIALSEAFELPPRSLISFTVKK